MQYPGELKYTQHDEWARIEDDVLVLGISDFAQDALGELVHVELPDLGRTVSAGDAICEVESVKAVAEVYAPVDGEVVEVNVTLDGQEGTVNRDPYGAGWLVKIRITNAAQLSNLLDAASYRSSKG